MEKASEANLLATLFNLGKQETEVHLLSGHYSSVTSLTKCLSFDMQDHHKKLNDANFKEQFC